MGQENFLNENNKFVILFFVFFFENIYHCRFIFVLNEKEMFVIKILPEKNIHG